MLCIIGGLDPTTPVLTIALLSSRLRHLQQRASAMTLKRKLKNMLKKIDMIIDKRNIGNGSRVRNQFINPTARELAQYDIPPTMF